MISDKDRRLRLKLTETFHLLNEKQKRILAASEAKAYGHGGVTKVALYTGLCRQTIYRGVKELRANPTNEKIRREGGGRKKKTYKYPELISVLESLMEPSTRGDPESPLRWTSKSVRALNKELKVLGYSLSPQTVANILHELDYSLQANKKNSEGKQDHPDRNEQFEFINKKVKNFLKKTFPVISVDTKKKELLGNYANKGREWGKKKRPIEVLTHDFPDPEIPKAIPYGIYDLGLNQGLVNVGISADTAEFAVEYKKMVEILWKKIIPEVFRNFDMRRQWWK